MQKTWGFYILGLTILFIAAWYNLEAIGMKPGIEAADLIKLLSALLFISLIVERVLEVFISAWRGEGKARLEFQVSQLKRALSWVEIEKKTQVQERIKADDDKSKGQENRDAAEDLEKKFGQKFIELGAAEQKLALYHVETKLKAVPWGVFLGILVSALGFRTLQPLLDPGAVEKLSHFHATLLRVADIVLTGGLIGGGSDGLHKVIQAFIDFMESTSKRAKAASEPKPGD